MNDQELDNFAKRRTQPRQDFFTAFGFSIKRGIYLSKNVIKKDGPSGSDAGYRQQVTRFARRLLPYLTLGVLIANVVVYEHQSAVMERQATIMATQATIMGDQREMSARALADNEAEKRAQIAIENIVVKVADIPKNKNLSWNAERRLLVQFNLHNVGSSIAKGISDYVAGFSTMNPAGQAGYELGTDLPQSQLDSIKPSPSGGSIVAGQTRPESAVILTNQWFVDAMSNGTARGSYAIMVCYLDIFGQKQLSEDSVCYIPQFKEFRRCIHGHINN
jgi:hypothetical protein